MNNKTTGYPILDRMIRLGLPLTRQNYLILDRWETNAELTPEEEENIPPQFRKDYEDEGS